MVLTSRWFAGTSGPVCQACSGNWQRDRELTGEPSVIEAVHRESRKAVGDRRIILRVVVHDRLLEAGFLWRERVGTARVAARARDAHVEVVPRHRGDPDPGAR